MNTLKAILLAFTVMNLVACAQKMSSPNSQVQSGPDDSYLTAPGETTRDGTLDGGGGNGINGKPLESYRVNIRELSEFKEYIQPLFDGLNINESTNMPLSLLNYVVDTKAWYFVPVDLETIPGDAIGVFFETEQIGFQKHGEVWISTLKYSGNLNERAELLLHEIAMGIKILSFDSEYRQCMANKTWASQDIATTCGVEYDISGTAKKIELSSLDYQAVRALTKQLQVFRDQLVKAKQDITRVNEITQSLLQYLGSSGFNTSVHTFWDMSDQVENSEISRRNFANMIKFQPKLLGQLPIYQYYDEDGKMTQKVCKLNINQDPNDDTKLNIDLVVGNINIKFTDAASKPISIRTLLSKENIKFPRVLKSEVNHVASSYSLSSHSFDHGADSTPAGEILSEMNLWVELVDFPLILGFEVEQTMRIKDIGKSPSSAWGMLLDKNHPQSLRGFCKLKRE